MKINLYIEQLALHGINLSQADQAELIAALQSELASRLTGLNDPGHWQNLGGQRELKAKPIHYQPGSNPVQLGQDIAASLATALNPMSPREED